MRSGEGKQGTAGNGCLDEGVKLFVTTDGKLQVTRGDTLYAQIARGIAGQLEHLSAKILADGSHVNSRCGTDAAMARHTILQVPMDTAHRKLPYARNRNQQYDLLLA